MPSQMRIAGEEDAAAPESSRYGVFYSVIGKVGGTVRVAFASARLTRVPMRLSIANWTGVQFIVRSTWVQVKAPNRRPLSENAEAINERTPFTPSFSLKKPAVAG